MSRLTKEQIDRINEFQKCRMFHPLTCGGDRGNEAHEAYAREHGDQYWGLLIATEEGLVCPVCDYRQKWVPDAALDFDPKVFAIHTL